MTDQPVMYNLFESKAPATPFAFVQDLSWPAPRGLVRGSHVLLRTRDNELLELASEKHVPDTRFSTLEFLNGELYDAMGGRLRQTLTRTPVPHGLPLGVYPRASCAMSIDDVLVVGQSWQLPGSTICKGAVTFAHPDGTVKTSPRDDWVKAVTVLGNDAYDAGDYGLCNTRTGDKISERRIVALATRENTLIAASWHAIYAIDPSGKETLLWQGKPTDLVRDVTVHQGDVFHVIDAGEDVTGSRPYWGDQFRLICTRDGTIVRDQQPVIYSAKSDGQALYLAQSALSHSVSARLIAQETGQDGFMKEGHEFLKFSPDYIRNLCFVDDAFVERAKKTATRLAHSAPSRF